MSIVTVAGHPHSGTTWLARILAEICDGATPVGGGKPTASTDWRVQRTHGEPGAEYGIAVLTRRDPRDVLVSLHNRHPHQPWAKLAADLVVQWPTTLDRWRAVGAIETSYEALVQDGEAEVIRLGLDVFGIGILQPYAQAYLQAYHPPKGPRPVGAWREDLPPRWAYVIDSSLGVRMEAEGYALGGQ